MNFGEYFARKRKEVGLSQKDIADYLLISIPTISKWENNERYPDLYSIGGLAKLFNVDLESLLKLEDSKNNNYDDDNKFDINAFSAYFKKLRKSNGYSLKTLSVKLDVTYQTISKWENSETLPSVLTLIKCAELFDIPIQDLYYGKKLDTTKKEQKPAKKGIFNIIFASFSSICLITSIVLFSLLGISNNTPSSANKVAITFDFSEFVEDVTILINKGEKVVKYNPNIEGYDLSYTVNNETFDFSTPIYQDTTIKCDFNIKTFIVRFYGQYDELIKQENVNYGASASAPSISSDNDDYVFYGWDKKYDNVKSDLDIYPLFKYNKADITFDAAGGEMDIDYIQEYSPSDFDSLPIPTKKGHTFLGWYLNDELFTREMEVYTPIILVARYSANTYKVYLDPLEGNVDIGVIDVIYNTNLNLPIPYLTNHDFAGWYLDDTLIPINYLYDFDHDIYLDAIYSLSSDSYSYRLIDNEAIITKYNGSHEHINLPESINGYKVVGIDEGTFEPNKDNIKSIKFHKHIKYYQNACLNLANLEKIYVHGDNVLNVAPLFNDNFNDTFNTIEIYGDSDIIPIASKLKNNSNKTFEIIYSNNSESCTYGSSNNYVHKVVINATYGYDTISEWHNLESCILLRNNYPFLVNNCNKLNEIILPEGIIEGQDSQFYNNISLKTITLPDSIKSIGEGAFYNTGLEEIYLGDNITIIGAKAFGECFNLKRVYYKGTVEDWLNIIFEDETASPLYYGAKLYIDGIEVIDERIYS